MTSLKKWLAVAMVPTLALALVACGDTSDGSGNNANNANNANNGKGDGTNNATDPLNLICDIANNTNTEPEFALFADPIAKFVLSGEGECPRSYAELVERLSANDPDCAPKEGAEDTTPENGFESYVVSETAQLAGTPNGQSYRVVVSHQCSGKSFSDRRPRHQLFMSLFGIGAAKADPGPNAEDWRIPEEGIEVMAFDEVAGVYNYYEVGGNGWTFFGNSNDMLNHDGGRCQECHTGGGPIMKELDTPWVHWEGHEDQPGAKDLVEAHKDVLGKKASGSTLESLVKAGNKEWNEFRLEFRKGVGTKELVRPLFCAMEINVDNAVDFKGSDMRELKRDFFFDPHLRGANGVPMAEAIYQAAIEEAGQTVPGTAETDTVFKFVYPERAHADNDYVDKLKAAGIIDDDLMLDVLMVDFTQPVFSQSRCELLEFVPDLGNDPTAAGLRDGMVANLEAASPAADSVEAQLLANLQNVEDAADHESRVKGFVDACKGRDQAEMMADALEVAGDWRNQAREREVFEFPAAMPTFTNLDPRPGVKLNPETCIAE